LETEPILIPSSKKSIEFKVPLFAVIDHKKVNVFVPIFSDTLKLLITGAVCVNGGIGVGVTPPLPPPFDEGGLTEPPEGGLITLPESLPVPSSFELGILLFGGVLLVGVFNKIFFKSAPLIQKSDTGK